MTINIQKRERQIWLGIMPFINPSLGVYGDNS